MEWIAWCRMLCTVARRSNPAPSLSSLKQFDPVEVLPVEARQDTPGFQSREASWKPVGVTNNSRAWTRCSNLQTPQGPMRICENHMSRESPDDINSFIRHLEQRTT